MSAPIRYVTTRDGVGIAYCDHGGDGRPLVFVRGWISHLELMWEDARFRSYFEPLARHLRLVRYDGRGNGLSERHVDHLGLDDLVADLESVMDGLCLDDTVLYASTYGGPIAVRYTDRHPERVRAVVLEGTYGRGAELVSPDGREEVMAVVTMLERAPGAGFAALASMTAPDSTDSLSAAADFGRRSINPKAAKQLYTLGFEVDVTEELRRLPVPALVLHRRRSHAVPFALARRVAALVPDARLVALEGTAHNAWTERPADALAALAEFLDLPLATGGRRSAPVTVLFTDLQGSTALTSRLGDSAAQVLLEEHDVLVRQVLDAWEGIRIKHTGDGVMASFASVTAALGAATGLQEALRSRNQDRLDAPLNVRIGLNAGEPLERDGDLFGTAVQLAARLCAAADPGQVLVSNVVRELAAGKGFEFDDLGERELRAISTPVRVHALRWED